MAVGSKSLKKELNLLDVYAIAMGTTISSGFFLLPGLAFAEAGPALVLSYIIAAVLVVPAMFSMVELATAMPRAGGAYYFLDRSMGPLVGTIGGLGTWLVLILKSAFALIGMGAYLGLFFPNLPIVPLAVVLALLFGFINLIGAKKTGAFQVALVLGLLVILLWFLGVGAFQVQAAHFTNFFADGMGSLFATAGLVYISYAGLTKITGVAEEVKNPERNLSLGMFLALGTAIVLYGVGTWVMVGVIPPERLAGDLTPVATAAGMLVGPWGRFALTIAAVLSFFAAANASVLSASRYPMAMSRDHLLPAFFRRLTARGVPDGSVYVTVGLTLFCLVALDPMKIAKLAGAFQLLMFSLLCLAVIVMRESRIESYDPGYRSPFYPWLQLFGVFVPFGIIFKMGTLSILFSLGLLACCVAWYFYYARPRVRREGAIYHIFARLGKNRYEGLDRELRGILKEKGIRQEDPFEEVVARAACIDLPGSPAFADIVAQVSGHLARRIPGTAREITEAFLRGTRVGATPVTHGVALPHIRVDNLPHPELVVVRSRSGVVVPISEVLGSEAEAGGVHALFFLVSPNDNPGQHLRLLAQIAGRVDEADFRASWFAAADEQELKEVLLRDEHFLSFPVTGQQKSAELVGQAIRDVSWPDGSLVVLVQRDGRTVFPRGGTVLEEGDRLTVIGEPTGMQQLYDRYVGRDATHRAEEDDPSRA